MRWKNQVRARPGIVVADKRHERDDRPTLENRRAQPPCFIPLQVSNMTRNQVDE